MSVMFYFCAAQLNKEGNNAAYVLAKRDIGSVRHGASNATINFESGKYF